MSSAMVAGSLTYTLANALTEGVLEIDALGRVRGVNRAACALFDVLEYPPPAGRMLGLTLLEATHLRTLADLCAEALRDEETRERDVQQVGGVSRTLRVKAIPLPEGQGCLLVLTDITEILRLKTVRTDFIANVSHELRTPLASIRATAETLLDGAVSDPEYSTRFLNTIIKEADRLVRLSADLLELSRAESTERERVRFDLRSLVAEVTARLAAYAERREVALFLPEAGKPCPIEADYHEIDQVLFNLMDNAIKYTPRGGKVTIDLLRDPAKNQAVITVEDTGIGILSQDLPRIFERFWRADRARRFQSGEGGSGGTGLGLSIVKHIVEAHGGTIRADSILGQGSRFTVALPLKPETADTASESATRQAVVQE